MSTRKGFLFATLFLLTGAFIARLPATIAQITGAAPANWTAAFEDVRRLIVTKYVEAPDEDALLRGAIKGMTDALNDPYTEFIPPADREAFEKDLTGQFVGIGATVSTQGGWLTIVYPLEDSPALAAGLEPEDKVTAIDGESTKGLAVDQCVKKLLGEPGTKVKLTIERACPVPAGAEPGTPAETTTFDVTLARAPIAARATKGYRWDPLRQDWDYALPPASPEDANQPPVVYTRLQQFTPGCADEVRVAIDSAVKVPGVTRPSPRPGAVILDLRDNGGGLMDEAIRLADMFLDGGEVVSTKGRTGATQSFRARAGGPFVGVPVVILVNGSSASASEIVAGALSDNQRAVILGTRTFGKGLVQRIEQVANVPGAQLKLTEQHYYLPSGRLIQRTDGSKVWGVDPTQGFYLPVPEDRALVLAIARREMEVIRPRTAAFPPLPRPIAGRTPPALFGDAARFGDPEWIDSTLGDPQLAAAVRAARSRIATSAWTPTGLPLPDQTAAISSAELNRLTRLRDRFALEMERVEKRIDALTDPQAAALAPTADLWPDALDLTGGRVEVYDKAGQRVVLLDVTGPDLERWLLDADVKARPGDAPAAPTAPAPPAAPKP
jgi:carboxyl-terminal processing protease